MNKKIIRTKKAPAAIGPYSQAVQLENLIFTSGQIPINPKTGEMPETIEEQTKQVLDNVSSILKEAGTSLEQALKLTVFLTDINDFAAMNEVYASYFKDTPPARSAFEVAALPKGARLEIDCIAYLK